MVGLAGRVGARLRMSLEFTNFLASLSPSGSPLSREPFDEVWTRLQRLLVSELRRRGLWYAPPSYLGIYGTPTWSGPEGRDGLDELTSDLYTYIFIERLRSLQIQLEIKSNIEGLVVRQMRNFLTDRQRAIDPLGYRAFQILRVAVTELLNAGEIFIVSPPLHNSGRLYGFMIRNHTILAFSNEAGNLISIEELRPIVERWNDELLPEIITSRTRAALAVQNRLKRRLGDIDQEGYRMFRFGDLLTAFKADLRTRWAELFNNDEGEEVLGDMSEAARSRLVPPDDSYEEKEYFEALVACVDAAVRNIEASKRTRVYLLEYWMYLRSWCRDELQGQPLDDRLPSQRRLSQLLGIPRERFPALNEIIRQQVLECRSTLAGEKKGVTQI